jgi:chitin synthase
LTSGAGHDQGQHQRLMSMGGMSTGDYWQDGGHQQGKPSPLSTGMPSTDNLLGVHTPPPRAHSTTPLGYSQSRPVSQVDFMRMGGGPDDESIVEAIRHVLREVDLETITKKQGMFCPLLGDVR